MHRQKRWVITLFSILVLSLLTTAAAAQGVPRTDKSYSVKLDLVFGSDSDAAGRELPGGFSALRNRLAADYGYRNFSVLDHQESRVSGTGSTEVRGMTQLVNAATEGDGPTFLEWVTRMGQSGAAGSAPLDHFRLGVRVPVRTRAGEGAATTVVYEGIGITVNRMEVPIGQPQVLGSFRLPDREGTLFIVVRIDDAAM